MLIPKSRSHPVFETTKIHYTLCLNTHMVIVISSIYPEDGITPTLIGVSEPYLQMRGQAQPDDSNSRGGFFVTWSSFHNPGNGNSLSIFRIQLKMVYCGRPSKGCANCRKRKIRVGHHFLQELMPRPDANVTHVPPVRPD